MVSQRDLIAFCDDPVPKGNIQRFHLGPLVFGFGRNFLLIVPFI